METTLLEKDRVYKRLNGKRAKMDIYEINGVKISIDKSETLLEERYRPRLLDDLIITDEIYNQLNGYIHTNTLPHLLLYSQLGGSGKSSISQVLINEFNTDYLTIPLNIDRGMDAVKNKAVNFAQNLSQFGQFKILAIEEIGDATQMAIDSFKSVIDQYGKNARIIITTNSMAKISQPLKTRFTVIDFNKISEDKHNEIYKKIFNRLKAILTLEEVQYTDNDIVVLMKKYGFSYRELLHSLGECLVNKKLVINNLLNKDISSLDDILKLVNNSNVNELAKISASINHIQIMEELSEQYLDIINDINSIQPFIMRLNDLQRDIANGVMLPDISFLDFLLKLIQDKIKFKV